MYIIVSPRASNEDWTETTLPLQGVAVRLPACFAPKGYKTRALVRSCRLFVVFVVSNSKKTEKPGDSGLITTLPFMAPPQSASDKSGSILRLETTINNVLPFQSYRTSENDPEGEAKWRVMRRSVADLHRRAEVSQQSKAFARK